MSGIAEILLSAGLSVSGSDIRQTRVTDRLAQLGGTIFIGHDAEQIGDADVVVMSPAIPPENPEILAATHRRIPVIRGAEMLAEIMRMKYSVAISGTHGKTTTTAMTAAVLECGGLDPTVVVGGRLVSLGSNARLGHGEFMVVEADEAYGSIKKFWPTVAVVTAVDYDHLDYYKDIRDIGETFLEFINKVPFYGAAVLCLDQENIQHLIPRIEKRFITYGIETNADITADEIQFDGPTTTYRVRRKTVTSKSEAIKNTAKQALNKAVQEIEAEGMSLRGTKQSRDVANAMNEVNRRSGSSVKQTNHAVASEQSNHERSEAIPDEHFVIASCLATLHKLREQTEGEVDNAILGNIHLKMPGQHNVLNSLAAITVGLELDIPFAKIAEALESFQGVHRRFEIIGEVNGVLIVDDYAHNPAKLQATFRAAHNSYDRRIVAVFQPHRYQRVKHLAEEFSRSFYQTDILIVTDIYGAGEQPIEGVTAEKLAIAIREHGHKDVTYIPDNDQITDYLASIVQPHDIVITVGAGDIWTVGRQLLEKISNYESVNYTQRT